MPTEELPQAVEEVKPSEPAKTETPATDDLGENGKKALEAERARARDAEKRAKDLERELDKHRQAAMSEAEKAVAEAEKRGEATAAERYAGRLVDEALRAATVGKVLTPDAVLSFDRKQFIVDGDVNREALTKWVADNAVDSSKPPPTFAGGPRTSEPQRAKSLDEAIAVRLAPKSR